MDTTERNKIKVIFNGITKKENRVSLQHKPAVYWAGCTGSDLVWQSLGSELWVLCLQETEAWD